MASAVPQSVMEVAEERAMRVRVGDVDKAGTPADVRSRRLQRQHPRRGRPASYGSRYRREQRSCRRICPGVFISVDHALTAHRRTHFAWLCIRFPTPLHSVGDGRTFALRGQRRCVVFSGPGASSRRGVENRGWPTCRLVARRLGQLHDVYACCGERRDFLVP